MNSFILPTLAVLIISLYYAVVPSESAKLGSLQNVTDLHDYSPSWPEHGFVDLSHGNTKYYILGPKTGRKLLFVHGLGSPAPTFKPFLDKLAQKGYRILTFDIYGRGHSDSPATKYDDGLLIGQVTELVHKLKWGKTLVLGLSMGGLITTGFVSRNPELVEGVGYIAPAGLLKGLPPLAYVLKVPILGSLFLHLFGSQIIINLSTKSHKPKFMKVDDVLFFNRLQTIHVKNNPGFLRAFGSTVVNVNWGGYAERYKSLETTHKGKVFAIWGELDDVVPTVLHKELQHLIPRAKIVVHKEYSHSIPIENSQLVADELDDFYKSIIVEDVQDDDYGGVKGSEKKGWFGL